MLFNVYTGDGNDGTSFDHEIEADDIEGAVKVYMEGVAEKNRDLFNDDDGDEDTAILCVYEGPDGERAYNGGAYFVAEIRKADTDPRGRW
jgi:hypothetical protein